jgi:DNA-binding HxlR family transcriptional regulator
VVSQFRSGCPIASALDMVGDKWSLIIVRDLLNGKRRFSQFLDSPERITPSVLTDKLSSLMRHELVVRQLYSERPKRYEFHLTPKGEGMIVILRLCASGGRRTFQGRGRPRRVLCNGGCSKRLD